MRDQRQLYYATNKEIHDFLASAKQKITEGVLHELLRDRGIFCSPAESRDALVEYLSLLTHDYLDVCGVMEKRETGRRGEKYTAATLPVELGPDELKVIIAGYKKDEDQEIVRSHKKSETEYVMNVTYSEFDYSKTKLLQRQEQESEIIFEKVPGGTKVRLPANDRSRGILEKIKGRAETLKKKEIAIKEIELTDLASADHRTTFFTRLISSLPNFSLETVSRLRVAHSSVSFAEGDSIDLEGEDPDDVADKLIGIVENVALSGENLVASEMYQELKSKGFFITAITWRARQKVAPHIIVECDAGFEDGQSGKKFRYSVHGALKLRNGVYTKNIRPVDAVEKARILGMIEATARSVLDELLEEANPA